MDQLNIIQYLKDKIAFLIAFQYFNCCFKNTVQNS